jgi:3-phosphoshikimate 1-carboxyvinyltransferase
MKAPSSKSLTHRYLVTSALAEGHSVIKYPLISIDTEATAKALSILGTEIIKKDDRWEINGGFLTTPNIPLDCKESGTTLRLLTGVCALVNGCTELMGSPTLFQRPMKPLTDALIRLGVRVERIEDQNKIKVYGGDLEGGEVEIRGDISSQFISSLLLVAPYAKSNMEITVTTSLESKPYVEMTLDTMRKHGVSVNASDDLRKLIIPIKKYEPKEAIIEGDWSSVAYILAAGILAGGVTISNIRKKSKQADLQIINILEQMGANLEIYEEEITARKSILKGIRVDFKDCPDLFPIVCALCSIAEGESTLKGIKRLKLKESDRVFSMIKGLEKMGADIQENNGILSIVGRKLKGAFIDPFKDHRIAMSLGVLALVAEGKTIIKDAECVDKSYPQFWDDLHSLGLKMVKSYE